MSESISQVADLGLESGDQTPLAVKGEQMSSRGDVRAKADALADTLRAEGALRVAVRSDDPVDIVRTLAAGAAAGADVFIAHTNIPAEKFDAIVAERGVQFVVGAEDKATGVSGGDAPQNAPSGRVFMMTSGTTGMPKIAEHSLTSLMARALNSTKSQDAAGARWLLTYQPTGFAGVQVILTATLTKGLIVSPKERNPGGFAEAAKTWQVSQISGTPTFWRSFLMAASPKEMALKQITLGGEASDQATLDRISAAFPDARVTHVYASTEAGVVFAVHDGKAGFPVEWLEQEGPDIKQGTQVRIRDGYLQIKTPNAMRGYLSGAEQPHLDDGWLGTADLCEIREDRVFILGRQDSTINVGGSKVYPLAVETELLSIPGVVEARVYGVSNPIAGSLVGADVVIADGEDPKEARGRILAAAREKLAGYQVPRVFKIVDKIEVRESGKKG